jgi:hypothetical protein
MIKTSKITKISSLEDRIFEITNEKDFNETAIEVFYFQYSHNILYRQYCDLLHCRPDLINRIEDIPFLPVSFFKTHFIKTTVFEPEVIFESSGTSGSATSRHLVKSADLYRHSYLNAFRLFYGAPSDYCILALLPSYLEKGNSSLVYMVKGWMQQSGHPANGFYLHNYTELAAALAGLEQKEQKTLLIGVTYALLDFAALFPHPLKHTMIMETGGMKGRMKEIVRSEVHGQLMEAFGVETVQSEYGMTELLSQAYAKEGGSFSTPPWMKVVLRDEDDHRSVLSVANGTLTGGLNIIDLANLYSCSFIATEDVGRLRSDGTFEVLGRMDNTDIRGCSLLAL